MGSIGVRCAADTLMTRYTSQDGENTRKTAAAQHRRSPEGLSARTAE